MNASRVSDFTQYWDKAPPDWSPRLRAEDPKEFSSHSGRLGTCASTVKPTHSFATPHKNACGG